MARLPCHLSLFPSCRHFPIFLILFPTSSPTLAHSASLAVLSSPGQLCEVEVYCCLPEFHVMYTAVMLLRSFVSSVNDETGTVSDSLVCCQVSIDRLTSLDIVNRLFESVAASVFRPIDILLKVLFAKPKKLVSSLYISQSCSACMYECWIFCG